MTLPRIRTDCFSIRKSSTKVAASWTSGSATGLWRACRRRVNGPNLDGLTNQNKSIWSKILAILPARNKDMRPTISLKKWTFWRIGRIFFQHLMFFDIGISIHIESQLNIFCFVADISSKMEMFAVSENRSAAILCKTAILCTSVLSHPVNQKPRDYGQLVVNNKNFLVFCR
jgi:hypothetical protein